MHVEEDPGAVADEEGGHDGHQEDGEVVLRHPAPAPPPLPDHKPDLIVEERDGDEGDNPQYHEPFYLIYLVLSEEGRSNVYLVQL